MVSFGNPTFTFVMLLSFFFSMQFSESSRKLSALVQEQPVILRYHDGVLLKGNYTVNLIWYGVFSPAQRSILIDFIQSLNRPQDKPLALTVSSWWKITEKYWSGSSNLFLGQQSLDQNYSLGRSLKTQDLVLLASKVDRKHAINIVFTDKDVLVEGFCMSRCGSHGSAKINDERFAHIWVGNSETQCPGLCAWPFHEPIYGPQTPPLLAPNGDVGVDGMVINLATLLAGTVTNPFNNGYFQGSPSAPLEAASACTGIFGKGAYPGYPGEVLIDKITGSSYNARGLNNRRFLLPAMWDPQSKSCATLV